MSSVTSSNFDQQAQHIEPALTQLYNHLLRGLVNIGYLEGVVDNELVRTKVERSLSGHVIDTATHAIARQVILFITRSLDKRNNSVPEVLRRMRGLGAEMEQRRSQDHPGWPADYLEVGQIEIRIADVARQVEEISLSRSYTAILRMRDEHLAHLVEGSGTVSRRLARQGLTLEHPSFDDIIQAGRATAAAICEVRRIWLFQVFAWQDMISTYRGHTRQFFNALPVLREAERSVSRD